METTLDTRFKLKFFYVTDKNTFVIFDRDVEKILNKSAKDLAKKQTKEQLMLGHMWFDVRNICQFKIG